MTHLSRVAPGRYRAQLEADAGAFFNLVHPALAPVRAWFDANVPAEYRGDACLRKIYA